MGHISAKWLVVIAGLVSTAASLVGGLLMYVEGLRILEEAVEEIGSSELRSLAGKLEKRTLATEKVVLQNTDVLVSETGKQVDTREKLAQWVRDVGAPQLARSEMGQGAAGYFGQIPSNASTFDTTFLDLVVQGITAENKLEVMHFHLEREQESCAFPCVMCRLLTDDPPYTPVKYVNNLTTGLVRMALANKRKYNIPPNKGFWMGPFSWQASDDNPYQYMLHATVTPQLSSPMLAGAEMFSFSLMQSNVFEDVVAQVEGKDSRIVVIQTIKENRVLAARGLEMREAAKCGRQSFQVCTPTLEDIVDEDYRRTIVAVNKTGESIFKRFNAIWVKKERIFRNDNNATVVVDPGFSSMYVVWLRPVSSINGKLNSALFLFVGFVCGVFIFDVVIGVLEIVLVARPLKVLSLVAGSIEQLRLAEAREILENGTTNVSEVRNLQKGFSFVIASLEEYKTYLPQTLFVADESDDEPASVTSQTARSSTNVSEKSLHQANATRVCLQRNKVGSVLIRLPDITEGSEDITSRYASTISVIEETTKLVKGALHPFLAGDCTTLLVTFSLGNALDKAMTASCLLAKKVHAGFGVAVGTHQVGNLGSSTFRCYGIIGGITDVLLACQQIAFRASRLFAKGVVIAEEETSRIVVDRFRSETVLILKKVAGQCVLRQVTDMLDEGNEEWMYELDKVRESSVSDFIRKAAKTPSAATVQELHGLSTVGAGQLLLHVVEKVKRTGDLGYLYCVMRNGASAPCFDAESSKAAVR